VGSVCGKRMSGSQQRRRHLGLAREKKKRTKVELHLTLSGSMSRVALARCSVPKTHWN
jgi:hypothetical protein